jgi:hypothetical protein
MSISEEHSFYMYIDKQRPAATPAFFFYVKNQKGERGRKRNLPLHSEQNIFFFSSFIDLLFISFFLLKPPHCSAVLFVLARTQVTSSFSSSSLLASYFSSIHPSIHLSISYALPSNKK